MLTMERLQTRVTVVGIVKSFLKKYYEEGKLNDLRFEEINVAVKVVFPDSKFNPLHFAHYKHKFLTKLDYIKAPRYTKSGIHYRAIRRPNILGEDLE